tara:strand:- start:33 stop:689 length:657 start_codon:yes stop_codon:yes gene_type:complete
MLEKGYYKDKKDRCFILGTGPSINDIDLSHLEDEVTIGVNQICVTMVPDFIVVSDNTCLLKNEHVIFNEKTRENSSFVFSSNGGGIELPERFYIPNSKVLRCIEEIPYFIDDKFEKVTNTGGSVVQDLAISLACWLGFKEINLLGCDGGFRHFFQPDGTDGDVQGLERKHGIIRPRQRWNLVMEELDKRKISLYNCSPTNALKGVKYKEYSLNWESIE